MLWQSYYAGHREYIAPPPPPTKDEDDKPLCSSILLAIIALIALGIMIVGIIYTLNKSGSNGKVINHYPKAEGE